MDPFRRNESPNITFVAEGEKIPDGLLDKPASFHRGGTIENINKQIGSLDASLTSYDTSTRLVVDTYLKKHGLQLEEDEEEFGYGKLQIDYKLPKQVVRAISNKEAEAKELSKFAGVYSVRSVLQTSGHNPLQAESNLSLALKKKQKKRAEKSSNMKPMLVELHVFPGFEPHELTPLPLPLVASEILMTVIQSQRDLNKKPGLKKDMIARLLSKMSEAVLQDTFWWFFLEKYQSVKTIQELLFNRIAHNYVKLIFTAPVTKFRDTVLKRYPHLVAQAVYCTFCSAFPTSYKQFGDEFKEDLVQLIDQWMVGTKPVPRVWQKWHFAALEPPDMRKDEQIKKDASKGSLVSLPVDLTEENLAKQYSLSSVEQVRPRYKSMLHITAADRASNAGLSTNAQRRERRRTVAVIRQTRKESLMPVPEPTASKTRLTVDFDREPESATSQSPSHTTNIHAKDSQFSLTGPHKGPDKSRESCPVGKGPEFGRSVFDIHGHSPLVQQFLKMQRLDKDCGTSVLVQRTEIKSLPPLSAPTYREVIKESLKFSHALGSSYRKMNEENARQRALFARKQKEGDRDFTRREGELLARQKDVKRISELLFLELAKDGDEQSSGKVAQAVATAMGYTEEKS